jgi:hypothetical protein
MTMEAKELLAEVYEAKAVIDTASLALEVAKKRFEQQQDLGGFEDPHASITMEEVAHLYEALDRRSGFASTEHSREKTTSYQGKLRTSGSSDSRGR